jgi:HEAT repeat protein
VLPEEIASTYHRLMEAIESAVRHGITAEDLTHGHSLMADPSARAIQEMLPALAKDNLPILRSVLRGASEEAQRAAAAYVIAYAPRKSDIVNDLQFALQDGDAGVRSNAAAGLAALAVLARLDPATDVKVQPTWFIEMLNSLSWSDRNKALWALQILTDTRDAGVLAQLRERALPALIEMARWKSLSHALPAYVLLGRLGGLPEQEIQKAWERGDRESVITAATKKASK